MRVAELSTWKNRSKMRSWFSGAIPMPSSDTVTSTSPVASSRIAVMATVPPAGVNFTALLPKFSKMRSIFS